MAEYITSRVLVELLGDQAAWTLLSTKGGTPVYIPAEVPPSHWLSDLIGPGAAAALCDHFAMGSAHGAKLVGTNLDLPRPSYSMRRAKFRELEGQGLSATAIAIQLGCSTRLVRKYRQLERAAAR